MHTEYRWCIQQAEDDANVRVVVVTGAGRAFCAGADAAALEGHIEKGGYDPGIRGGNTRTRATACVPEFDANFAFHFGLSKPVIAAVNGPAAGVGLVLACFADLRFAARGAKLTTAHGKLAAPAEYGLSWVLPRIIGLTHANDLLLSSRTLLAEETEGWGLFNAIVEPEDLLPRTYEYARMLATRVSPSSMRETRRQVYTDMHRDIGNSVRDSEALLDRMMREPDYREGVAAFTGKRDPDFGGADRSASSSPAGT